MIKIIKDNNRYNIFMFNKNNTLMNYMDFKYNITKSKFRYKLAYILKSIPGNYFLESNPIRNKYSYVFFTIILTRQFDNMQCDPTKYMSYFNTTKKVVAFNSLSRNVRLVVPVPVRQVFSEHATGPSSDNKNFLNIRTFFKNADNKYIDAFFETLNKELTNEFPYYLSTHGLSVPYFHFRIQHEPKYYTSRLDYFESILDDYRLIKGIVHTYDIPTYRPISPYVANRSYTYSNNGFICRFYYLDSKHPLSQYAKYELAEVYLYPELRGKGLSKRLLMDAMSYFTKTSVILWVESTNKIAIQLYKSVGFKEIKLMIDIKVPSFIKGPILFLKK